MKSGYDLDWLLKTYAFNLAYADELVRDLSGEQMYKSFGAGWKIILRLPSDIW